DGDGRTDPGNEGQHFEWLADPEPDSGPRRPIRQPDAAKRSQRARAVHHAAYGDGRERHPVDDRGSAPEDGDPRPRVPGNAELARVASGHARPPQRDGQSLSLGPAAAVSAEAHRAAGWATDGHAATAGAPSRCAVGRPAVRCDTAAGAEVAGDARDAR